MSYELPFREIVYSEVEVPEAALDYLRAAYLAEVAFMDQQIGRLVRTLRERKLYDNATIVLVADHGEFLGERAICRTPGSPRYDSDFCQAYRANERQGMIMLGTVITTEDPQNNFIPDYGRITAYRGATGMGIRLDGGTAYSGAVITRFYDSLLEKVTAWAPTPEAAIARMDRALREFRIRGVSTNIAFVENLLKHPTFLNNEYHTKFIDQTAELFDFKVRRDRATKILTYIADITVPRSYVRPDGLDPVLLKLVTWFRFDPEATAERHPCARTNLLPVYPGRTQCR